MRPTVLSRSFAAVFVLAMSACSASAQQDYIPRAQDKPPGPPLSPAEAMKKMTVPEGFTVELVAAEPDIVNPVAMTFDEKGRVWVTESLEYPRKDAGKGRDRVKVLEDTDGDGKADKFSIFADGLNIPSGIAVGYGGVWVVNSPDLLFYPDADRDGKADGPPQVIVSGFGRDDTHELPNSLTWGPDGWLYGWNGVFNGAHIEYRGKTFDFTCAIWRIHPKTREFEVWCEGTSNPWGIAFNEDGDAFASACVIDHFWHLTESAYYHRQGGPYPPFTWKLESIVNFNHQKAAYCGVTYFDSDSYPKKYRGKFYMGNIHGNCINVDSTIKSGATYKAISQTDFLTAHDAWFMPVVQKTGPDGSLYILDWYDQYHCYQDANRDPAGVDRLKGRLYRVRYENTPRRANFDLGKSSDEELIALLGSGNSYDRDIAQRVLSERGETVQPKLFAVASDSARPRTQRLHALWAMMGAGPIDLLPHRKLLADSDPTIRAFAVRAAGNMKTVDSAVASTVKRLAADPDPTVRLQVAIAAKKIVGVDPMPVLIEVLSNSEKDAIIPAVVWQNLHPLLETGALAFIEATAKYPDSKPVASLSTRAIERLLARKAIDAQPVAILVDRLLKEPHIKNPFTATKAIESIASKLQTGEVSGAKANSLRDALRPVVAAYLDAHPGDTLRRVELKDPQKLTASEQKANLDALLKRSLMREIVMLAASWKDLVGLAEARQIVLSTDSLDDDRLRALAAIVAVQDEQALKVATSMRFYGLKNAEFQGKALAILGKLEDPKLAELVLARYPKLDVTAQPKAIELLTQRASWSRALVEAVTAKSIPTSALNINQIRTLQKSKDADLAKLAKAAFGVVREGRNPESEKLVAKYRDFVRNTPGDPFAGQKVFTKLCAQCHKIYGEGQEVGPDITGSGRNDFEQLLSNIFDPSLVIGTSYQATTVATTDGRILTGLLAEDNAQRIVLKLQGGKQEIIPRNQVDEVKLSALSLMPEDIEKQLTPQEWADLFSFLTLDKPPSDKTAKRLPGSVR